MQDDETACAVTDTAEAEADFNTLFDWIKQGRNQSTPNVYT